MATPAVRLVALAVIVFAPLVWAQAKPPEAPAPQETAPLPDPTSVTVDVGGSRIVLPAPAGWIDLTANREFLRTVLESTVPEESRLIATFTTVEGASSVDAGGDLAHWANAVSIRKLEQTGMTQAEFLQFRVVIRREWIKVVDLAREKSHQETKKSSDRLGEKLGVDVDATLEGLTSPGIFLDEPGVIGALLIIESGGSVEGESLESEIAVALMMMRVGARLVSLNVYRDHAGPPDLEAVKAVAVEWKDAIRAANPEDAEAPEYPAAPPSGDDS